MFDKIQSGFDPSYEQLNNVLSQYTYLYTYMAVYTDKDNVKYVFVKMLNTPIFYLPCWSLARCIIIIHIIFILFCFGR